MCVHDLGTLGVETKGDAP